MQTSLLINPKSQFFDSNGDPLAGGKLYLYEPGTSTLKSAYTDSNGNTALANPVILDSAGRASVWLNGYYKAILKDANETTIWTVDNVSSQYSDANTDFQYLLQNPSDLTYVDTENFSVSSDETDVYQVGRRIKVVVTAGTRYGTITASSAGGSPTTTTVTVLFDSGQLDSGLSAVSLGVITPSNTSLPIQPVVEKSANYSMAITDINKIIHANSANAMTFTLVGANQVPSGAWNLFENANAGAVTLNGTVNGVANHTLYNKESLFVWTDGNNWRAPGSMMNQIPIGTIQWWHKSLAGVPQTLPYGWVECIGQTLSDADSPLNGQTIPNINGSGLFVRGSNTSGNTQANQNLEHTHSANITAPGGNASETYGSVAGIGGASNTTMIPLQTVANNGNITIAANSGDYLASNTSTAESILRTIIPAANIASVLGATIANSGDAESRPDNISMVAIMRVK
jgi:hypothetical protein